MSDYAEFAPDPRVLVGGYVEADPAFAARQPAATVDEETFKSAMRALAGGVVMVIARKDERLWGLTISACCSISAQPPQILISLADDASCRDAILETRHFGVSVLRDDQKHLAELGAVPGAPKYVDAFCQDASGRRTTMIAGALVHVDCIVDRVFEVSDHTLLIGNVEAVVSPRDKDGGPLIYFDRRFHGLGDPLE
jgi:flavin reductase ActVB